LTDFTHSHFDRDAKPAKRLRRWKCRGWEWNSILHFKF
jgi:hypothetical protein